MKNICKTFLPLLLFLILVSPIMASPVQTTNIYKNSLSNIVIPPGALPVDDFNRTRNFVKDFADDMRNNHYYVEMTATSIMSKDPTWLPDDPNAPVGTVTYSQYPLSDVVPYSGNDYTSFYISPFF